jgi:hypothetical protein
LATLAGGVAAEVTVDLLGAGVAVISDVIDHRREQRRVDTLDVVADLDVVEVQVLGTDQEDVVGLTVPDAAQQPGGELHQAAGLAEALVLFEQCDQVLERGVEGIGLADLFGDLFHGPRGDVAAVLRGLDLLGEGLGNGVHLRTVRQLREEALLENLAYLVASELDRRDGLGLASGFLLEVGYDPGQILGLRLVAARQVGDDHTAARQLDGRGEQVADGVGDQIGQGAPAHGAGVGVEQVGRQLVQQDQGRLVADDLHPLLLVDSAGAVDPVRAYQVGLAQLLGDLAPDVMFRVVSPVEGGDARVAEVEPLREVDRQHARAQLRVFREQTEGHHQVRLTAAHGLGQLERGLVGLPGKPQQGLPE